MTKEKSALVRRVLESLGLESNFGNYRKFNGVIDWWSYVRFLDKPTKVALCHIVDRHGELVEVYGSPVQVAEEIEDCTDDCARKILAKQSKRFVKWW